MAHYKRKKPRTKPCGGYSPNGLRHRLGIAEEDVRWLDTWPRYHDKIFHIRLPRHQVKILEKEILKDIDPGERLWPRYRRPHHYYW